MHPQAKPYLWLCLVLLLVSAAFAPASAGKTPPAHPTLTVGCKAGPGNYATIQSAVDNAGGGYTIQICAGTYKENVNINDATKHLPAPLDTLDGLRIEAADGTKLKCPTKWVGSGFDLHAHGVSIKNIVVEDCGVAISVEFGFGGERFSQDSLHDNGIAIAFNGGVGNSSVINCEIFSNSGDGVFDFQSVLPNFYFSNEVENNGGNGIEISSGFFASAFVFNNDLNHNSQNGIYINNADGLEIKWNTAENNGNDGIYINGQDEFAIVEANDADRNQNIGIEASSSSANNVFLENRMENNVAFDASDHSTSNSWTTNPVTGNNDNRCHNFTAAAFCQSN